MTTAVEKLFIEMDKARVRGDLIFKESHTDKEYHFQNWVGERLSACNIQFDEPGRNTYPDFRVVDEPVGFEVKGLAFPGRQDNYDANSQVPSGFYKGREIYYIFGRYPKSEPGVQEYPVFDLVMCHGSFLNSDSDYVHKNKSFRGFGSYGDIMIRDRKMYVVPTPYYLVDGTVGKFTLIVPDDFPTPSDDLIYLGDLERREVSKKVVGYNFDLETNEISTTLADNERESQTRIFHAYRGASNDHNPTVSISEKAIEYERILAEKYGSMKED